MSALAAAADVSTVLCPACSPASSTPDIVTRSPVPTTSCDAPKLTAVPVGDATSYTTITTTRTITSCAPTVTNCPVGSKTTEVVTVPVTGSKGPTSMGNAPTMGNAPGTNVAPGHSMAPTAVPIGAAGSVKAMGGAAAAVAAVVALAL